MGHEFTNRQGFLAVFKDKELCLKYNLNFPEAGHFSVLSKKHRTFTKQKLR